MADFTLDGRVKVRTLKEEFKKNFGATLRVYTNVDCKVLADDEATLASIRAEGYAGGEFSVKGNMKVAGFERRVAELYGIGVQVANADDTAFADDTATLMGAAATSSETSGKAQFTSEDLAKKSNENSAPNVQATAAELASARVRVYGKAQNRTALGIAHAYMVMYPHAKLEDLRQAFPNSLNPAREIFAEYKGNAEDSKFGSYFSQPDELLTMGDGTKVQFAMMWTKPDFEKIANHAKQYGILIADFEKADGGAKKGGFRLEYLNGYVPPVPGKKRLKWWVWLLIALFVIGTLQLFYDAITKPTIVEKEIEKVVEVEKIVYVDRVEEIEKNFNSATFIAGKADLSDDAKFVLHDLAQLMEKHPELRLKLVGHTSSEGDPVFNQKLSEARAKAAVDFLIARGIDADRLESEGKGSSEPLDENNPEVNRRTEFIVLE